MNKFYKSISKAVASLATAVLFVYPFFSFIDMDAAIKKSSIVPDFAYPKTVQIDADKNLSTAIAKNDWNLATCAIIQSITASNIISHDSVSSNLMRLDGYINSAPTNWKPALLLIEADIFNSIYNSMRWNADHRKLPSDSIPPNPYDWSRDLFAIRIYSICSEIMANKDNDNILLKEWMDLTVNNDIAIKYGMTIDEFLLLKCSDLLNVYADETDDVIPFFKNTTEDTTPGQKCRALRDKAIDMLIARSSARGQNMLEAEFLIKKANFLPFSLRQPFMMTEFEKLKDSEGSQILLQGLEANVVSADSHYYPDFMLSNMQYAELLKKSIAQFPNGQYVNALKNILNNYISPSANIQYKSQYLSSSDISMDVTLSNCNQSYLLIYDYSKYKNAKQSPRLSVMAANCRLVKAIKVNADGTPPFSKKVSADIGKLPVGTYVVVPSATPNHKGIYSSISRQTWLQPFVVCDISVITLDCLDATNRVFVVDGADGHPIEGATVSIYSRKNYSSDRYLIATLTTNHEGFVNVSEKNCEVEASYNGSTWSNRMRIYNTAQPTDTATHKFVSILPDRSIYHPGDSIRAVFIAYSSKENNLCLYIDKEFTIELHDANGKTIISQTATTDHFGRATVNFQIPNDALLGNWSLYASDTKRRSYDYVYFQVADYVPPTFFITSEDSNCDVSAGDVVVLKGQVLTYSRMPVVNAKVNYTVRYQPPMRWWATSNASYNSSVSTDTEGKYSISLPTGNLKNTQFEKGVFSVEVSATSPAGETQSGPSTRFGLGQDYSISSPSSPTYFDISDSIPNFVFNVRDILGNNVKKKLKYALTNKATGAVAAEGLFESPCLKLTDIYLPSAKYDLKVSLSDNSEVNSEISFVLWRKSEPTAPAGVKLWIPHSDVYASPGDLKTFITIGSGIHDRWIPIVLSGHGKILDFKWLHISKENIQVPVVLPSGHDRFIMNVNFISDLDVENSQINFYGPEVDNRLEIKTESFRDKISAGDNEHWKFRFDKKFGDVNEIPVIAVMTDAALNHLNPFRWNFRPSPISNSNYAFFRNVFDSYRYADFNLKNSKYLSWKSLYFPNLNDYGQGWGLQGYYDGSIVYAESVTNEAFSAVHISSRLYTAEKKLAMSAGATIDLAAPMVAETADEADDSRSAESSVAGHDYQENTNQEELRESECPIAFFLPYLSTDKNGVVDINFTVPNFNTTWALQVLGYDESLNSAYKKLESVASKPVMVSTHSPRFVRTGDVVELAATIFNNTGQPTKLTGRIELVNLLTSEIIASKDFPAEMIAASSSKIISMRWSVPSDVSSVGFRAYASAIGHRDGEQALLPVLPAYSPVVDSTPFWLAPNHYDFEIKLPKFNNSDHITLQYCNNPVWYCLTAIPDIMQPNSKSILVKSANLFCNATAYNLIASNSSLKKGLTTLLSDNNSRFAALKSNLEKDGNIKITELSATPWVNDAESESLRMSRLSGLLDAEMAKKIICAEFDELKKLQTSDGGWSWCPDMKPSSFITRFVLNDLSMMSSNGALKILSGSTEVIKSAIGFVDSQTLKDYKKSYKKGESLSYLLGWLFDRSCFAEEMIPDNKISRELAPIYAKAVSDIETEWKSLDIYGKATAAMLLWRYGKKKSAFQILESLRQYASRTDDKGVWFDNINSGLMGASSLQTTSTVLNAFAEIQPDDPMVDGLRQWLVMNRQIQDWGKNRYNLMVVNSILTSGSEWTADSGVTEFRLGGKALSIPDEAALTGAFTINLNPKDASAKKLKIKRSANGPAWGGVVCQYETPIEDVVATEIPQLSIKKQIVALVDDGNGTLVPKEGITIEKGMKVRVTLTISNDRNMDYMALTDERSACLEPIDQLSHYTTTDGVWYYKEVRDAVTNLYIEYLPKGHHVISYDCTVSQDGDFSCGIATIQSQYSPLIVAHSSGSLLQSR